MLAKLAYLTSPAPNRFVMNFQLPDTLGNDGFMQIEISRAHLANIIIDGASFSLRETSVNRVPVKQTEEAHERSTGVGT